MPPGYSPGGILQTKLLSLLAIVDLQPDGNTHLLLIYKILIIML